MGFYSQIHNVLVLLAWIVLITDATAYGVSRHTGDIRGVTVRPFNILYGKTLFGGGAAANLERNFTTSQD